jgi:hypothetical protein
MPLTDTQLLLLSAASQREDLLLVPPANPNSKAARTAMAKLLRAHLTEEVMVRPNEPHWQQDGENCIGYKLTSAGLQAIGIEPEEDGSQQPADGQARVAHAPAGSAPPREGSKKALVISLLRRQQGATLDDLVAATGWLPHTTRATLTGLRKGGYPVVTGKNEAGRTVYRLPAPEDQPSASGAA